MSGRIATIIGSTGMIGTYLLNLLLTDDYYETVRVLVRRPMNKTSSKIEIKLVDFNDTESYKLALEGTHTIFCAIGTTQQQVKGDKALYRRIDYDIPLHGATLGKEVGCGNFIVITAVSSNSKSNQFYVRLKGELEDALTALNLKSLHIFQPSVLLGDRKEHRGMERFLQSAMTKMSGLMRGSWRKYRAVEGKTVARAMIAASRKELPGVFRHEYDDILALGGEGMMNQQRHHA